MKVFFLRVLVINITVLLSSGCKDEIIQESIQKEILTCYEIFVDTKIDSTYLLENGMSLFMPKNCFDEEFVRLDYMFIQSPLDMVYNNILTLTEDRESIRSVGMIHLNFVNQKNKQLRPKEKFQIISAEISNEDIEDVAFFNSVSQNPFVLWAENHKNNETLIRFRPSMNEDKGQNIFLKNTNITISHFLDSIFDGVNNIPQNIDAMIRFNENNGELTYKEVYFLDWKGGVDINGVIENNLSKALSKEIFTHTRYDGDSTFWSAFGVRVFTTSVKELFSNNRVGFWTKNVGWLNFDIYIDAHKGHLELTNINVDKKYFIVSKEFRCESPIEYTNQTSSLKFSPPLLKKSEEWFVIYEDKSGNLIKIPITLIQDKEISIEVQR